MKSKFDDLYIGFEKKHILMETHFRSQKCRSLWNSIDMFAQWSLVQSDSYQMCLVGVEDV